MCLLERGVLKALVILSIVALIQAKGAPRFTKPPKKEYTVYEGDNVKLRCSVTGKDDPMHNRTLTAWKKFGGKGSGFVRKSRAWRRFRVKNGKYLRIRDTKLEDAGSYLCVAKNQHGTISAVIRLNVNAVLRTNSTLSRDLSTKRVPITTRSKKAPVFRNGKTVKAIQMSAGQQLKLSCKSRGIPTPKIKWRKNDVEIGKINRRRRRRISKWTLSFARVTSFDSGIYKCFVWNQYGNISKTFFVQVKGKVGERLMSPPPAKEKPVILEHLLTNVTANIGELVTFTCTALSTLVPRFTWLKWNTLNGTKNDTVISVLNSSSPNVRFVRESRRWPGNKMSYLHKLKLLNVSESDQGRYTCVASSQASSQASFVSSHVYLTVKSKSHSVKEIAQQLCISDHSVERIVCKYRASVDVKPRKIVRLVDSLAFTDNEQLVLIEAILEHPDKGPKGTKDETQKNSSSGSESIISDIELPLAALIAVPVAFGCILIVAIIWCYIQTVKQREKFSMNSQALPFPIANGTSTINGFCKEKTAKHNGVVMETLVNGNVVHDSETVVHPRVFPISNIHNENELQLSKPTEIRNGYRETAHNKALGCSHGNTRNTSSDSSSEAVDEILQDSEGIDEENCKCLSQNLQDRTLSRDHSEEDLNIQKNETNKNSRLQDCQEKCSSDGNEHVRNSVV